MNAKASDNSSHLGLAGLSSGIYAGPNLTSPPSNAFCHHQENERVCTVPSSKTLNADIAPEASAMLAWEPPARQNAKGYQGAWHRVTIPM